MQYLFIFYYVHDRTLYMHNRMRFNFAALHAASVASLYADVIFIFREAKSCIDIVGLCMLKNLQSRREGL